MNVALAKTDTGRAVDRVFDPVCDRLPGAPNVAAARRKAFEAFQQAGLPHRRLEEWKYTDLRALMREVLPLAGAPDAASLERARVALGACTIEGAARLVLVDGVFAPELSVDAEAGVSVRTLRDVLEGGDVELLHASATDAMIALNAALATDGVVIEVADGAALTRPIQLVHVATAASASVVTRSRLRLGNGAHAALVESFVAAEGARGYQSHDALIISVGDNAELSQLQLVADSADAVNITSAMYAIGASAKLNLFNLTSGGAVTRFQGFLTLAGEGSELSVNGVNLLKGTQHGDTTMVVDHAVPHCTSSRDFPRRGRRPRTFGIPGPHHRAPGCAKDRRQDDDAGAVAVR